MPGRHFRCKRWTDNPLQPHKLCWLGNDCTSCFRHNPRRFHPDSSLHLNSLAAGKCCSNKPRMCNWQKRCSPFREHKVRRIQHSRRHPQSRFSRRRCKLGWRIDQPCKPHSDNRTLRSISCYWRIWWCRFPRNPRPFPRRFGPHRHTLEADRPLAYQSRHPSSNRSQVHKSCRCRNDCRMCRHSRYRFQIRSSRRPSR